MSGKDTVLHRMYLLAGSLCDRGGWVLSSISLQGHKSHSWTQSPHDLTTAQWFHLLISPQQRILGFSMNFEGKCSEHWGSTTIRKPKRESGSCSWMQLKKHLSRRETNQSQFSSAKSPLLLLHFTVLILMFMVTELIVHLTTYHCQNWTVQEFMQTCSNWQGEEKRNSNLSHSSIN